MKEEDIFILAQSLVKCGILYSRGEQVFGLIENPCVQLDSIYDASATVHEFSNSEFCTLCKIFKFFSIGIRVHPSWNSALFEHWQYIRATPTPSMPTSIE